MEIINKQILILVIGFLTSNFTLAQNLQLNLSFLPKEKKVNLEIKSDSDLKIGANLEYANEHWKEISKNGLSKNHLYLFMYSNNKLLDNLVARRDVHPSEPPSHYEQQRKASEAKINAEIKLNARQSKNLKYDLLVYHNAEAVFKDYPCEVFNCWYEFYSLEKGKKYKMQVQLKIKSKIYKSNIVEFTY